ncbi:MAG TPA: hypothetical protein PK240_01720, partial [Comamonas denitrificans]|nr:hypothetical protein [Comamonas denitrificans]
CAVRPGVRQHRPAAGAGGGGQRCVSGDAINKGACYALFIKIYHLFNLKLAQFNRKQLHLLTYSVFPALFLFH